MFASLYKSYIKKGNWFIISDISVPFGSGAHPFAPFKWVGGWAASGFLVFCCIPLHFLAWRLVFVLYVYVKSQTSTNSFTLSLPHINTEHIISDTRCFFFLILLSRLDENFNCLILPSFLFCAVTILPNLRIHLWLLNKSNNSLFQV